MKYDGLIELLKKHTEVERNDSEDFNRNINFCTDRGEHYTIQYWANECYLKFSPQYKNAPRICFDDLKVTDTYPMIDGNLLSFHLFYKKHLISIIPINDDKDRSGNILKTVK